MENVEDDDGLEPKRGAERGTNPQALTRAGKFISYGDARFAKQEYLDANQRYRAASQSAPQLADEPLPFWRSLLTKIAWLLHRLANGTERTTSLSGIADAALNDAAADADAQGEGALVPFRGLQQVD